MGLDNGIQVVRNEYSNKIKALEKYAESWDKEKKLDFEFCYWRKCWNVRNDILCLVTEPYDGEGREVEVSVDELKDILKLLKSYNSNTWVDGSSIWSWEEHKSANARNIKNLKELIKLKKKYPELKVIFYDSY